jgi:phosphomannomutase
MTDRVERLCNSWKIPLIDLGLGNGVEEMLKAERLLGTVGRGGFCYGRHIPECDGILSGLFVAEMIAKAVKPLHEITQEIWNVVGRVHYDSLDTDYDVAAASQSIRSILNSPPKDLIAIGKYHLEKYEFKGRICGLKLQWGDCRWLLIEFLPFRPIIRFHCEGLSKEDVSTILDAGMKSFKT